MIVQESEIFFDQGCDWSEVCVVIPLHNYEDYIIETLNSILLQSIPDLSLVVVDDYSTDGSNVVVGHWMKQFASRFRRCVLLRNRQNAKLAITRNTGADFSKSELLFFVDADNLLYPSCLQRHQDVLHASPDAKAAYSLIEVFDADAGIMGAGVFSKSRFKYGNHIDAMAMLRRNFLLSISGYRDIKFGWEDYDLWLRMCEHDEFAIQIPQILSRYRVHRKSMLRTVTNVNNNHIKLRDHMMALHPWLELT